MFDLLVTLRLREAWAEAVADETTWLSRFDEFDPAYPLAWRDVLAPGGKADKLEIRPAYATMEPRLPEVVVSADEEPLEERFLGGGNTYETDDEGTTYEIASLLMRAHVTLTVFTPHPEATRALHRVVFGALMRSVGWMQERGYSGLQFDGAGDFRARPDLLPEYHGIYGREQRWSCLVEPSERVQAVTLRGYGQQATLDVE